jgi:hypothetical protein
VNPDRDPFLVAAIESFCICAAWHRAAGRPALARVLVARAVDLIRDHARWPAPLLAELAARAAALPRSPSWS